MKSIPDLPAEPDPLRLARHPLRWWLATRPAFLSLTFFALWPALAVAHPSLMTLLPRVLAGIGLALLTHAAVNVINDVADSHSGCDAANVERLFPFTGGSRFIQNGVLSQTAMQRLAILLFAAVCVGGLLLVWVAGPLLLLIGGIGVGLGWGYSAEPFKLNSRGLGELSVVVCFTLIPLGMVVLAGLPLTLAEWLVSLPTGLLAASLLYINQFPDRTADRSAGKWHWVARLETRHARWGYAVLSGSAYLVLLYAVVQGYVPSPALLGLLTLPLSARAFRVLWRCHDRPAGLFGAIVATIAAANLFPLLVTLGVWFG